MPWRHHWVAESKKRNQVVGWSFEFNVSTWRIVLKIPKLDKEAWYWRYHLTLYSEVIAKNTRCRDTPSNRGTSGEESNSQNWNIYRFTGVLATCHDTFGELKKRWANNPRTRNLLRSYRLVFRRHCYLYFPEYGPLRTSCDDVLPLALLINISIVLSKGKWLKNIRCLLIQRKVFGPCLGRQQRERILELFPRVQIHIY